MEKDKIDNDVGDEAVLSKEVDDNKGENAKEDKNEDEDEKVAGDGNKVDEKENEGVEVVEENKREDEMVVEDLKLEGEGKRKDIMETEDVKEVEDEMLAGEGEQGVEKEEEGEKVEGDVDKEDGSEEVGEKVAEDEKEQKNEKGTEGKIGDENGEDDVKMAEGEKDNEEEYTVGEMEEESKSVEREDMVEAKLDEMMEKDIKPVKPKVGKGTKRSRANSSGQKSDIDKKRKTVAKERESETPSEKETLPKTPTSSLMDRPVRERKSVERLVAIIEKDPARDFHIEKGRGTALKDIPHVAYNLSKKKNADTLKLLHTILFARREKAGQIKNNISRFSGFVWHVNEERQMIKVKEKLDKCVKEKLIEFCDILDIPVSRTRSRKEDVIRKLIEFLMEPHATALDFLADKEQSGKEKKRKRGSVSAPGVNTRPLNGSSLKRCAETKSTPNKGGEAESSQSESENVSEEDKQEMDEDKDVNGVQDISGDEVPEKAESEQKQCESEQESDEDKGEKKQVSEKSSAKKRYVAKAKTKEVKISNKASPPPKKSFPKSPKTEPRKKDDKSGKKSSGRTADDELTKKPTLNESASKESIGKKLLKVRDKYRENKSGPSDNELRDAISKILKEVDFNTATFTDILKLLVKQFDADLTPRKSSIKSMIQDELAKLEEDEDDNGEADKDEKKSSAKSVDA